MADQVTVDGADWCGDTHRALRHLDKVGVSYNYIDIDNDPSVPSGSELDGALKK